MKVAIAKEGNLVSAHFGHCEGFEVYEIENNEIVSKTFVENPGHRPGFLPKYLAERNVNVIISGGMGANAQEIFRRNNIEVIVGASGELENVIKEFIDGKLKTTNSVCHEHKHHDSCGNH